MNGSLLQPFISADAVKQCVGTAVLLGPIWFNTDLMRSLFSVQDTDRSLSVVKMQH